LSREPKLYCGEKKHVGGKMVRVCIEVVGGVVKKLMVTGDFFIEPEELCEQIESMLKNIEVRGDLEKAEKLLINRVIELKARFYGVSEDDFIEALSRAFSKAFSSG